MSFYKPRSFFVFLVIHVCSVVSGDSVNPSLSHSADKQSQMSPWSSVVGNSPVFKPALDSSFFSLNLLSSFPEDLEVNEYCRELLHLFGQQYVAHASCLVPAARPVRLCQNCFSTYASVLEIYNNISSNQVGPGNVSCGETLLHSDRLGLVSLLFVNVKTMWDTAVCSQCVKDRGPTNDTLNYMANLNQTLTCFEKYRQGNHTELCANCKNIYRDLNELYGRMEMNLTLCIDLDDAMNMTRKMWSTKFNCSLPREESVPVIAVSSFMLFLPIIFYLSSFLHSEQKKRKLIHPKRAKSYTSLMNIQDKLN